MDGWMKGWLAILHPFQQYFSHIRTMGDDNESVCNGYPVYSREDFALRGSRTRDR